MSRKARTALLRLSVLLLLLLLLPAGLYLGVYMRYRLAPAPGLPQAVASAAMANLRGALNSQAKPAAEHPLPDNRPLWVTLSLDGKRLFRARLDQGGLEQRLEQARALITADDQLKTLSGAERKRARFKLDLAVGEGPILSGIPFFFAKGLVPGLDGICMKQQTSSEADTLEACLLPDELYSRQLLSGYQPFYFMHEFKTGLDLQATVDLLADRLDLTMEQWRTGTRAYHRVRLQAFVEAPDASGTALPVRRLRANPPREITAADVRLAVTRAANYVVRQMRDDGKFEYIYYPLEDRHSPPGEYSLPRHAGTTWFLALALKTTGDKRVGAAADRAITYLAANAVPDACRETPYACVGNDKHADLGSAALAAVAISEYQQATGNKSYARLAHRLGSFILHMQKPNGDFCHQYAPDRKERDCKEILLYYSGEATLALAKLYKATGDKRYLPALERAMDFLVGGKYDFFLGQFFISEDHWTCIAADVMPETLNKESYARFCYAFSALNRRAQVLPGEGIMGDLSGAFSITPFFMPHNTPVGSRTEANVGTLLLARRRGEETPELRAVVMDALRFLVDHMIKPDSAWHYRNPAAAEGGILQTPVRASIRIDYVQHAAAALARALPLFD